MSVRAGIKQTTVAPRSASAWAFAIHSPTARPYGGFKKTVSPCQLCANPFSLSVKYFAHLAFSSVAAASSVKLNSRFKRSKNSCGVSHSFDLLENNVSVFIKTQDNNSLNRSGSSYVV